MGDERTFPEIEFINRTAEEIQSDEIQAMEKTIGRRLSMADPMRLVAAWDSVINQQLYEAINESAKMNVPRYCFGEYLDSAAENFHYTVERLKPSAATVRVRFTLSVPAERETPVPVGTRVTADGAVLFAVEDTAVIPAGETSVEVTARCMTEGTAGNGYLSGQINACMDNDAVRNLKSVENTTESQGGSAEESDADFYERMRQSQGAYTTTGARASYIYMAMSANPAVSDVEVVSPKPCCVDVYVMLENGQIPGEETRKEILDYINPKDTRALCDYVRVLAPEKVPFSVDVTWYYENRGTGAETVKKSVEEAVNEYVQWQCEKMGRDINPSELIYRMKRAGAKRVEIRAPEFGRVDRKQVAVIDTESVTYGGEEDA